MQLSIGQTRPVGTWDQGPITRALHLCETPAWASTGGGYLEHPSPACPCPCLGRCQLREQSRDRLGRMRSMGTDGGSRVGQDDCGGLRNWGPGGASCPPGKVGSLVWPAPTPGPSSPYPTGWLWLQEHPPTSVAPLLQCPFPVTSLQSSLWPVQFPLIPAAGGTPGIQLKEPVGIVRAGVPWPTPALRRTARTSGIDGWRRMSQTGLFRGQGEAWTRSSTLLERRVQDQREEM